MPQFLNKTVGPIGYGMMGLTWRPDPQPVEKSIETLRAAVEAGATLWNGAEFYGPASYNSLVLLKQYFAKYPEDAKRVTIAIKGGIDPTTLNPDGSPEGIRRSANNVLEQLGGAAKIDIFVIARRDHNNDFGETLSILQREYVDTGKFGGIGISECSAATVHEAARHIKVAGAEVELSMFSPDILNNGVAKACAEHDIPVIAYSPIGRGVLTGQIKSQADAAYLGRLGSFPRFQDEQLAHNLKLVEKVEAIASRKKVTAAQLAIAWVASVGRRDDQPTIVPIPGATTVSRVQENTGSAGVELGADDLTELNTLVDGFKTAGGRYPDGAHTEL